VRRSDTGPGKPYWKRPEGSTGATAAAAALGSIVPTAMGAGGRGAIFEGTAMVGEVAVTAWVVSCLLAPKNTAVVAAPTAAEAPATAARVNLLMVAGTIGEMLRRGIEEAAGRAWSICLPSPLNNNSTRTGHLFSKSGSFTCRQRFAQPISKHRGSQTRACDPMSRKLRYQHNHIVQLLYLLDCI
jgi:hypothetical protein